MENAPVSVGPGLASQIKCRYWDFSSTMSPEKTFLCKNSKEKHLAGKDLN